MQSLLNPKKKIIWIDLDNTPHVLFFRPIIPVLRKHGFKVIVTARDAYQVTDVVDLYKLDCKKIGRHYGKNKIMKLIGTFIRAFELIPSVLFNRPSIAVSHGSRSQIVAANLLFIPTLAIFDYEHSSTLFFTMTKWALAPEVVVREFKGHKATKNTFSYPGIKEDAYVPSFTPDVNIRHLLGISDEKIMVLVRPPATEAHYHNPEADVIMNALLPFISEQGAVSVVVPRNHRQKDNITTKFSKILEDGGLIITNQVYDGLLMIWYADLVVSGGGTMNREAAALGVPVYSIFRGKLGAVDRYLSNEGKLVLIENEKDVKSKIKIQSRVKDTVLHTSGNETLNAIIEKIETLCK